MMLIGIYAAMTPELLYTLARMGHGDELALVDANYPANRSAATCIEPEVVRLPGLDAAQATSLITSVMPLDGFVPHCALRMQVDDAPDQVEPVHKEVFDHLSEVMPEGAGLGSIERQEFYERASQVFAVVQCAEVRAFGCFILRKGVVF